MVTDNNSKRFVKISLTLLCPVMLISLELDDSEHLCTLSLAIL